MKTINKRTWLVGLLIILMSIWMYKITSKGATNDPKSPQSTLEVQSPPEQNIPKDPFKEALEKQSQSTEGQQTLIQPIIQVAPGKDPFKEFLEKQAKDLGQSKVSPFGVPADK